MNRVRCKLCGSPECDIIIEGRDRLSRSNEKFSVVRCRGCGLIYTLPYISAEEMQKYYPEGYYSIRDGAFSQGICGFEDWFSRRYSRLLWKILSGKRTTLSRLIDFLESIFLFSFYRYRNRCIPYKDKPGRLLDIGCGDGKLLSEQKKLGWEVYGVELERKMSSYARKERSLNVVTGKFMDVEYKENFFDVINLNHVLEHFLKPLIELGKINNILKPGGLVVINIPNYSRIETAIFGRRWHAYELPRHRFHYNRKTLINMLRKNGLEPVRVAQVLNVNNFILSTRYILEDNGFPGRMIGFFNVNNKMLRAFFLPFALVLKAIGQSSEMLIYAKKA
ncbi:MAG: class I SAM-dependent methyltransferase [Candidatus Omnitrophota bacterium]|nr:class I SAM-dependent methyltransferase [Candidatus Omnitrophota bacterium]